MAALKSPWLATSRCVALACGKPISTSFVMLVWSATGPAVWSWSSDETVVCLCLLCSILAAPRSLCTFCLSSAMLVLPVVVTDFCICLFSDLLVVALFACTPCACCLPGVILLLPRLRFVLFKRGCGACCCACTATSCCVDGDVSLGRCSMSLRCRHRVLLSWLSCVLPCLDCGGATSVRTLGPCSIISR